MPRYFFHICNGDGFTEDEEGRELPDQETAHSAAVTDARSLMAMEMQEGRLNLASFIEVESDGALLFTLTFKDAVTIEG